MTARSVAALLALAIAAAAAPAQAQFWPPIPEKQKKGRLLLGPVALTPRLELRNAGVDTNVLVQPVDPTRDTSIVLRASTDVYVPFGRRVRVAGTGWLDFNYFADSSDQRSTDPGAQGRVEVDVSRLTLVAGGGAFNSRQLYSTDIDQRIERSENWMNGGLRLRLSSALSAEAGVEGHGYRWNPTPDQDQTVKRQLDRDSTVWKGGLRYRVTPLTELVASAEKIDDTFLFSLPGLETTTSYRYLAGFELGDKAFLSGRFLGGVRDIPGDSAGTVAPYTGPAFQAAIVAPFLQRFRLTLSYDRDVYYSATGEDALDATRRNTFTDGRFNASVDVDAPFAMVLRLTGGYDDARYLRPYPLPGGGTIERQDRTSLWGASLFRRIGESAMVGFTALHTHRSSNYPLSDYDRWQYGLSGVVNP